MPRLSRLFLGEAGMVVIFLVAFVLVSLLVPSFFTERNLLGVLQAIVTVGIVAGTMMLCLATRDFDLSVGSTAALAGIIAVMVSNATGSLLLGILAALAVGAAVGLVNGFFVAWLKINPLITTLATMQIVRGAALILANGRAIGMSHPDFPALALTRIVGLPLPVVVMLVAFVVAGFVLNRTVFGRNVLAIGGNPEGARLAGVQVRMTRTLIFTAQGAAAALAGILLTARIASGQPTAGQGLELSVISACVLGGVSLAGGRATISGVIIGVMILGIADNAMNLLNIQAFYQYLVRGTILLAAVTIDSMRTSR